MWVSYYRKLVLLRNKLKTPVLPQQNGKLISAKTLTILNEFYYLHTNSIYTVGKIFELEITKLIMFFKKSSFSSTENGRGHLFEANWYEKLTMLASVPNISILRTFSQHVRENWFFEFVEKSGQNETIYFSKLSTSIFHFKWVNLMYKPRQYYVWPPHN